LAYGEQVITEILAELKENDLSINQIIPLLENLFGKNLALSLFTQLSKVELKNFDNFELETYLFQEFWLCYESKILELEIHNPGIITGLERTLILVYIDIAWKEHLQKMALLRDAVRWRGYGQRNPLYEYKEEAYDLFQDRSLATRHLMIYDLIRSSIL